MFDVLPYEDFRDEADYEADEHFWQQRLAFLSDAERQPSALAKLPGFPGWAASPEQGNAFAQAIRRSYSRVVCCLYQAGWGRVRGAFDIVTGQCYMVSDGKLVRANDLPEVFNLELGMGLGEAATLSYVRSTNGTAHMFLLDQPRSNEPRSLGAVLRDMAISPIELTRVVEALSRAGQLPALQKTARSMPVVC